jgi:antitoxin component of MazEF toxin-antitoxin module
MSNLIIMGYRIKVQKVERPTNRSYYVNLPVVLAEAIHVKKGEHWEWTVSNQNTLVLSRVKGQKTKRQAPTR